MRQILYALRQFGFDPIRTYVAIRFLPKYLTSCVIFLWKSKNWSLRFSPALQDFQSSAGNADGHYFWQDLICAGWIFSEKPLRHLDIGSRVDGFVAHLLAFREVELMDIRPLELKLPNLVTTIGDAQRSMPELARKFDSVSCLHAIEHFGLGRYGDPLDPSGHEKGIKNISELVSIGGSLFLSFPIGNKAKIEFNSQRILEIDWAIKNLTDFELLEFVLIPWKGTPEHFSKFSKEILISNGSAGLFKFKRIK